MKVYVASSWRNDRQPAVVEALQAAGYEVYDFRHPTPGDSGFHWSEIDPNWHRWDADTYREALGHPVARHGFRNDMNALMEADVVVLVLPCGRSAHLELGHACGSGKPTAILLANDNEPELMYRMVTLLANDVIEVIEWLKAMSRDGSKRAQPEGIEIRAGSDAELLAAIQRSLDGPD